MPNAPHRYQYDVFRQMLVDERKRASLTQSEVARKLLRPQSFVSKYERGERRLDVTEFIEIADALGLNIQRFFRAYRKRIG